MADFQFLNLKMEPIERLPGFESPDPVIRVRGLGLLDARRDLIQLSLPGKID